MILTRYQVPWFFKVLRHQKKKVQNIKLYRVNYLTLQSFLELDHFPKRIQKFVSGKSYLPFDMYQDHPPPQ